MITPEQPTFCPIKEVKVPPLWRKTPPVVQVEFPKLKGLPPMSMDSKARAHYVPTYKINQHTLFGRAGMVPFTGEGDERLYFFNVFDGMDRGVKSLNMSDFGGRVEDGESFMAAATGETLEESLGVFNFEQLEKEIFSISKAIYTEDRALVTVFVPVTLISPPIALCQSFTERLKELNRLRKKVSRDLLGKGFSKMRRPKPDMSEKTELYDLIVDDDSPIREGKINIKETADILYISKPDLLKMLDGEVVPLPEKLLEAVEGRYVNYPPLWDIIASRIRETHALD